MFRKRRGTQISQTSPIVESGNVSIGPVEGTSQDQVASTSATYKQSVAPPLTDVAKISNYIETNQSFKKPNSHIKSTYKFYNVENGNDVKDCKPKLINLPLEFDFKSEISVKVLTLALKELCLLEDRIQTLILCSSMKEIRMVSYCITLLNNRNLITYIPQLQGLFPSENEMRSIFSKFYDGSCLLTDNTGIKGMEAKRVIIFVDYNEYHEKHLINETLSRGNSSVYIILHSHATNGTSSRETLGNIFEDLAEKQLLQIENVTVRDDYSNFNKPFRKEEGKFEINNVCPLKQGSNQTFEDYLTSFDREFPVKQTQENYRYILTYEDE